MSIAETAKELLQKGIELGDEELINMANNLLKSTQEQSSTKEEAAKQIQDDIAKKSVENIPEDSREDCVVSIKRGEQSSNSGKKRARTEKIDITKRSNSFNDDGSEHADVTTPSFQPSPRKRKAFNNIDVVCTRCSKKLTVHPIHKRENFICNSCIKR